MDLLNIDVSAFDTLLLDRDGVINRLRPNDYVKSWDEFEFMPGILDALACWNNRFKYIFVVTNQRGVGKGLMTEESLNAIHQRMLSEIEKHGGRIDKIYYCTALTEDDMNRKPGIGMFLQILNDYPDIRKEKCLMIGDSESDMMFAKNSNIKGVKII